MAEYLSKEDMSTGEYISRDEALKAMQYCCKNCNNYNGAMCRACDNADEMDIICDIPAADVQPVKRGKWKQVSTQVDEYNNHLYECTVCRSTDRHNINVNVPYCWHCGAKMEG